MKLATMAKVLATGLVLVFLVVEVFASDPIFVKWLVIDDPGDETIRYYWQQAEAGALGPEELVDLGTMLFYRGWSNDAETYFRQALDIDSKMSEPWFRIGFVRHHGGDLSGAESAYNKCLKRQSGHAWANFYLGLLEEQEGKAKSAMEHFETAFKHAPELTDPKVNPEILSSKLQIGAQVRHYDRERFERHAPMPVLAPDTMRKVRRSLGAKPKPVAKTAATPTADVPATAVPTESGKAKTTAKSRKPKTGTAAAGTAGASAQRSQRGSPAAPTPDPSETTPFGFRGPTPSPDPTGSSGGSAPKIGDTSPEASLRPFWPALYELAEVWV